MRRGLAVLMVGAVAFTACGGGDSSVGQLEDASDRVEELENELSDLRAQLDTSVPATTAAPATTARRSETTAAPATTAAPETTVGPDTTAKPDVTTAPTSPAEAVVLTGVDADTLQLAEPLDESVLIVANCACPGQYDTFSVEGLDSNLGHVYGLINWYDTRSGSTLYVASDYLDPIAFLQVTGSGAWTVELRDPTDAPLLEDQASGTTPGVLRRTGPAGIFHFTYAGSGYVSVTVIDSDGHDGVVSQGGAFDGNIPIKTDSYVVIDASGPWSFSKT